MLAVASSLRWTSSLASTGAFRSPEESIPRPLDLCGNAVPLSYLSFLVPAGINHGEFLQVPEISGTAFPQRSKGRGIDSSGERKALADTQYGGKKDHGTVDALYPLISHIQTRKLKGRVVYCAMLDFETAYPSVSRLQLYTYLHEQGIQGQMLAVIKSLTKSIKVRVLHPHTTLREGLLKVQPQAHNSTRSS